MASENRQQSLNPGTVLRGPERQYTIKKVLGAGSFGITYEATAPIAVGNVIVNARFAIKEHFMSSCYRAENGINVLCTPQTRDEVVESRNDFIAEAKKLKELCNISRNIVKVNETLTKNDTAYYVMEFLDGGNPGKMDEQKAIKLIKEIAEAVSLIHENRILHLDIKPENIVLKMADDRSTFPVLIDFGIAKHFDKKGNPTSKILAKGASIGYAPPEQFGGISKFDPKYDVYALGALLLYLLTGKNPPDSRSVSPNQSELDAIIPTSISPKTRAAILNAMKPSAFERTATAKELVGQLPTFDTNSPETVIASNAESTGTIVLNQRHKSDNSINDESRHKRNFLRPTLISLAIVAIAIGIWQSGIFSTHISADMDTLQHQEQDIPVNTLPEADTLTPEESEVADLTPITEITEPEPTNQAEAKTEQKEREPNKQPKTEVKPQPHKPQEQKNNNQPQKINQTASQTDTDSPTMTQVQRLYAANINPNKVQRYAEFLKLCNEGYAKAYYPTAKLALSMGNIKDAKKYLQMSIDANLYVSECTQILNEIE